MSEVPLYLGARIGVPERSVLIEGCHRLLEARSIIIFLRASRECQKLT